MNNKFLETTTVTHHNISHSEEGQRLDNYLLARLKGVPKSMIYKIIRKGEVRINKKRVKAMQKLVAEDLLRLPPIKQSTPKEAYISKSAMSLANNIIYEDDDLIAFNKPTKLAVHGGSGLDFGVIELVRRTRTDLHYIELVHRLDRDTSGILLLAKNRKTLKALHQLLVEKKMDKTYLTLVRGNWRGPKIVEAPLRKDTLKSGERMSRVDPEGKASQTAFKVIEHYEGATLLAAKPLTGRTHQIRVHTYFMGHAIAGDEKYSDNDFNQKMKSHGLNRLFLHAKSLSFTLPSNGKKYELQCPMPNELKEIIQNIQN